MLAATITMGEKHNWLLLEEPLDLAPNFVSGHGAMHIQPQYLLQDASHVTGHITRNVEKLITRTRENQLIPAHVLVCNCCSVSLVVGWRDDTTVEGICWQA